MKLTRDRNGWVPPGQYVVEESIVLQSGEALHGDGHVFLQPRPGINAIEIAGEGALVDGIDIQGGNIGVNLRDGSSYCAVRHTRIRGTRIAGLWVGHCEGHTVDDCWVANTGDNVVQIEGGGVSMRNCALLRWQEMRGCALPNRVLCSGHAPSTSNQSNVEIVNCTIMDVRGQAASLEGWKGGTGLVFANNLIIARAPPPGSGGYAIYAPNVTGRGNTFAGNVILGAAPEGTFVAQWTEEDLALGDLKGMHFEAQSFDELAPATVHALQVGKGDARFGLRVDAEGKPRGRVIVSGAMGLPRPAPVAF